MNAASGRSPPTPLIVQIQSRLIVVGIVHPGHHEGVGELIGGRQICVESLAVMVDADEAADMIGRPIGLRCG